MSILEHKSYGELIRYLVVKYKTHGAIKYLLKSNRDRNESFKRFEFDINNYFKMKQRIHEREMRQDIMKLDF